VAWRDAASAPCRRRRIGLEWADRGEAMNRWHNRYLSSRAHTLTAAVPNWRPVPAALEPPFVCDGGDRVRV
jgi:hypothetical protein